MWTVTAKYIVNKALTATKQSLPHRLEPPTPKADVHAGQQGYSKHNHHARIHNLVLQKEHNKVSQQWKDGTHTQPLQGKLRSTSIALQLSCVSTGNNNNPA